MKYLIICFLILSIGCTKKETAEEPHEQVSKNECDLSSPTLLLDSAKWPWGTPIDTIARQLKISQSQIDKVKVRGNIFDLNLPEENFCTINGQKPVMIKYSAGIGDQGPNGKLESVTLGFKRGPDLQTGELAEAVRQSGGTLMLHYGMNDHSPGGLFYELSSSLASIKDMGNGGKFQVVLDLTNNTDGSQSKYEKEKYDKLKAERKVYPTTNSPYQ